MAAAGVGVDVRGFFFFFAADVFGVFGGFAFGASGEDGGAARFRLRPGVGGLGLDGVFATLLIRFAGDLGADLGVGVFAFALALALDVEARTRRPCGVLRRRGVFASAFPSVFFLGVRAAGCSPRRAGVVVDALALLFAFAPVFFCDVRAGPATLAVGRRWRRLFGAIRWASPACLIGHVRWLCPGSRHTLHSVVRPLVPAPRERRDRTVKSASAPDVRSAASPSYASPNPKSCSLSAA